MFTTVLSGPQVSDDRDKTAFRLCVLCVLCGKNTHMKQAFTVITCLVVFAFLAGCDMRSETAKREMEKFNGTPTPTLEPTPTEVPIDPADVVQVDTSVQGETLSVNGQDQKKSLTCKKLDRVTINGDRCVVTIKGPCRQIVLNGDNNQVDGDAAMEISLNGANNTVNYSRFVNGKRPIITGSSSENTVAKVAASSTKK